MSLYQNQNQVAQTTIKGRTANIPNPSTISCQVDPGSVATLYPGSAVKLTTATANMITVDKAAVGDNIFGFVIWNAKKPNGWTAGMKVEVALPGSVMEMESSASFNRGTILDIVASGDLVVTHSAGTPVGIALDNATGANQLARVYIQIGLTV